MFEIAAYLFLVTVLLTSILVPVTSRLARRWGVLDHPDPRKIHKEPMPLSGGWALFAALSIVFWGHLLGAWLLRDSALMHSLPDRVRYFANMAPELMPRLLWVYLGAAAVFVLGLVDDIRGMSVKSRLVFQTIIAVGLVSIGLRPNLGFLPAWLSGLVGIVWLVGITNAFNFLDGLDGLSAGVALVATAALLAIMVMGNQPIVTFYLATLAGAQLGFLLHNFHPARCFLGSSGSLLLGYLMASSTLLVTFMIRNRGNWLLPVLAPLFILAIPIYDTTSVVLIRLIKRRSIAIGDQSHFHHRLLRLGFSHMQTVLFVYLIAFSVAISGVLLVKASLRDSAIILLQIAGILSIIGIAERVASRARREVLDRRRAVTERREKQPV
jgi:UDP-GlcNAc:undecaprenyl-phosphate GlcNAc-1-phosphate transferase